MNFQEKKSLLTLYSKLPTKNQLLLKSVQNAKKHGTPTILGIVNELEKQTTTPVDIEQTKEELQEAKRMGLIENILVNKEDRPTLKWRSLIPNNGKFRSFPIISRFLN